MTGICRQQVGGARDFSRGQEKESNLGMKDGRWQSFDHSSETMWEKVTLS